MKTISTVVNTHRTKVRDVRAFTVNLAMQCYHQGPMLFLLATWHFQHAPCSPPSTVEAGNTRLSLCTFSFLFFFQDLFILCMWVHCSCLQTHQKRASDPITDGCEPPCGCWELNAGPLEEQSVLLTTEPSLQLPSLRILTDCGIFSILFIEPEHFTFSPKDSTLWAVRWLLS